MILIPLGVPIAAIVFGEVWRDAGYAAMALAAFPIAGTLVSFASEVAKADGRPDIVARTQGVILLAGAVCMLALLPFDLVGVVAGFSLGWLAGGLFALSRVAGLIDVRTRSCSPRSAGADRRGVMVAVLTPLEFLVVKAESRGHRHRARADRRRGAARLAIYLGACASSPPTRCAR